MLSLRLLVLALASLSSVTAIVLTHQDGLDTLEILSAPHGIEKRACNYGSCDGCYSGFSYCKAFDRNEDCWACGVTWYVCDADGDVLAGDS